ncbi:hypothetical protein MASR2M78_33580 [Treponema sp.]
MIVSPQLYVGSINLNDGRITFLDLEDSTNDSGGIRLLMYNDSKIGINRDAAFPL